MTFLPIVARELRVASRRRATYWSRAVTAVGAIIVGLFVYLNSRTDASHILGQNLFEVLSWLAFIYCLGVGVNATADCLSEEKREGTLGLLFLTDLKGYDVIIGKLVATSLNAFYGLLAIFPVLAIPLLMGGITNGEFWRMALVLANTFLFSLTLGMFVSSISKYPRRAMAVTTILILIFAIGLPICQSWIGYIYRSPRWNYVFRIGTPDTAFTLVSDLEYIKAAKDFWWSVGVIHGLCWLLLTLASLIVPRSWQDNPPGAKAQRWRDSWHRWSYGDPGERRQFQSRLLDINAFFWLAGRARLKPAHVWFAFAGLACLWSWGAVEQGSEWMNPFVYFLTSIVLNTTLKIWVASEAGRRLGEDRKIGALELLLSTPLSVPDILEGQLLALRRQFLGPLVVALTVEAVLLLASLQSNHGGDPDEIMVSVAYGAAIMIMLVADLLALSALGMWVSLTAKNPNRATGITVRRILVLPWAVILVVFLFGTMVNAFAQSNTAGWKFFLALYFVTGIGADLWFGLGAWRRLQAEFREVAVQRFSTAPSIWSRLRRGQPQPAPAMPPVIAS